MAEKGETRKPDLAKAARPVSKTTRYVVAKGKALTVPGGMRGEGDAITAAEVADMEALLKGGYVVKA